MSQLGLLSRPKTDQAVLPPWDFQRECLDAVHAAFGRGVNRQLLSLATGAGKTVIASHAVRELEMAAVMIVHRDELVRQSVDKLSDVNPNLSVGVVQGPRDDLGCDITVASAQTLIQPRRLARLLASLPSRRLVISDECHHDLASGRRRILQELAPTLLLGLTATPHRADNLGLGHIYEEIVYHKSILELMASDHLARLRGKRIETGVDLEDVHTVAGEFNQSELEEAVDTDGRNQLVIDSWKKHAEGRRQTIAFCVDVAHALHLRDAFRADGVTAETVIGTTPSEERVRIFAAFHRGEIPVLTGCMVFTEGYDEPGIDCILMARPTKSLGLYIQMVGRGARKKAGKPDCLVLDFADTTSRHKLISLPSLAGKEPGDPAAAVAEELVARGDEDETFDLLSLSMAGEAVKERRAVEVDLFGMSTHVWQQAGDGWWMAPADAGSWIALAPRAGGERYLPYRVVNKRGEPPEYEQLFGRELDLEMAMGIAERHVAESALTKRDAGWRTRDEPPSDAQLRFARSLGIKGADTMRKAQLSEAIDASMFRRSIKQLKLGGGFK